MAATDSASEIAGVAERHADHSDVVVIGIGLVENILPIQFSFTGKTRPFVPPTSLAAWRLLAAFEGLLQLSQLGAGKITFEIVSDGLIVLTAGLEIALRTYIEPHPGVVAELHLFPGPALVDFCHMIAQAQLQGLSGTEVDIVRW